MKTARLKTTARKVSLAGVLLAFAGLSTGCVSQQEYDKLFETNQSLRSQNIDLQSRLDSTESTNSQLQGSAGDAQGVITQLSEENNALRGQLANAQHSFQQLEDRMNTLEIIHLDAATDQALTDLANQFPDMIVYDSDRGMLQFVSDMTFASGSDSVQSSASQSLSKLAGVLKSGSAAKYDLQIVGHTDSQKPSANTQRRHPTNMHLSAHRAIAVRNELGKAGISWDRMSVSGWGEYRPVVANNEKKGTKKNRRVEIFLVPSSRTEVPAASESSAPTQNTPAAQPTQRPRIDPTK